MSRRPRGGAPVTAGGVARLGGATGQDAGLRCHRPTRQTPCPTSARPALRKRPGGGAERVHDPAVPKTIAVDRALSPDDEALRRAVERSIVNTAHQPAAPTRDGLQTGPGIGHILRRVRLDALQASGRLPRVQAWASYARVVQCRQASAGKRVGPAGPHSGHAPRKWACAAAATWCRRHTPNGPTLLTRGANQPGPGKALTRLAPPRARAVSSRLTRPTAGASAICRRAARRRAGAPAVSRDTHGMSLHPARGIAGWAASWHAQPGRGPVSQRPGV
jgi:hypothetical protein